jgi:hypothetical protein
MPFIRKTFASLLILGLIMVTLFFSILTAIAETYLNKDFYKSEIFQTALYPTLIESITTIILEGKEELFFTEEELQNAFMEAVPSDFIAETAEELFNQLSQTPFPGEITFSAVDIKEKIPEVVEKLLQNADPSETLPNEEIIKGFESQIPDQVTFSTDSIPDNTKIMISILMGKSHLFAETFITAITMMLALIGLLIWKPWSTVCAWLGWALAIDAFSLYGWSASIKKSIPILQWAEIETSQIETFLSPFFRQMSLHSLIIAVAAGLFFTAYVLLKRKSS